MFCCFADKKQKKNKNKKKVNSLLFLSTLRGWIFPWALSQKLITLTIFAKSLRKIDKYLPFAKRNLHENSFTHLRDFLTFVCFRWKITWHLGKLNKKVKNERVSNWADTQSSCLGFTSFNVSPCLLPKRTD